MWIRAVIEARPLSLFASPGLTSPCRNADALGGKQLFDS